MIMTSTPKKHYITYIKHECAEEIGIHKSIK